MKIEIYSDVMCPWCYIGERRFAEALEDFAGEDVEVVFRSYQLDPNAPERPTPMREYLRGRFGAQAERMVDQVAEIARGEGIEMDYDRGLVVNTFTAHRLLRLAELEYGAEVQRSLAESLFSAHFERGLDVSDPVVLTRLAAETGVDAGRAREYLTSGEGVEETRAALAEAAERGIRAVPTFVFEGKYAVEGAQPSETFRSVLERVEAMSAGAGVADDGR